jgi:endonuclease YncB( thermonuclease family)
MSTLARRESARGGRWAANLTFGAVIALPASLASAENKAADPACRLAPFARAVAGAAIDGRTLVLDDGREVRLTGIEVGSPSREDAGAAGDRSRQHLQSQVAGNTVVLGGSGRDHDRYGRLLAQVHVLKGNSEHWLQAEMVATGHARVAASADGPCTAALLRHERAARAGALGLWSDPYYVVRRAEEPAAVAREQGRFAIVEGSVVSVRESGATIYVNFGRRWSEDFTVTIAKRNERAFMTAGLEPKRLNGRHVRVRGWIEERGGPLIEAVRPEQIEVMERR